MIIAIIFILMGIAFMIATLVYVKNKNNLLETKHIDKTKKAKKTLKNIWGIDGIFHQVVTINKNQHSIIIELESIEYSLLQEEEKNSVDMGLTRIARMIKYPIQFLEIKRKINLEEAIENIKINTINSNNSIKEYAKNIINHLEDIQKNEELFERKNYMIISSFNNRKTAEIELKEFYQLLKYHILITEKIQQILKHLKNL